MVPPNLIGNRSPFGVLVWVYRGRLTTLLGEETDGLFGIGEAGSFVNAILVNRSLSHISIDIDRIKITWHQASGFDNLFE